MAPLELVSSEEGATVVLPCGFQADPAPLTEVIWTKDNIRLEVIFNVFFLSVIFYFIADFIVQYCNGKEWNIDCKSPATLQENIFSLFRSLHFIN